MARVSIRGFGNVDVYFFFGRFRRGFVGSVVVGLE